MSFWARMSEWDSACAAVCDMEDLTQGEGIAEES